jgi:molecular chaperone GrpE
MADESDKDQKPDETTDEIVIDDTEDVSPAEASGESAKLKADLEKAKSDYLYLMADFDNFRKNAIKERSELLRFGSERLIREFLNIADNFERALESDSNPEKFREGVFMINQEMKSMLQRFGVTEVPTQGLLFDPSMHEALSSEPTDAVEPNHVARVFKKAYKLHDKLIRPAQVVVAVPPVKNTDA